MFEYYLLDVYDKKYIRHSLYLNKVLNNCELTLRKGKRIIYNYFETKTFIILSSV